MKKENNSSLVGITEITERYLPLSKRREQRFVSLYPKRFESGEVALRF